MSFVFLKLALCLRSVGFDFLSLIGGVVIQVAESNVDRPNCGTKNNGEVVNLFVLAYERLVRTGFSSGYVLDKDKISERGKLRVDLVRCSIDVFGGGLRLGARVISPVSKRGRH